MLEQIGIMNIWIRIYGFQALMVVRLKKMQSDLRRNFYLFFKF